MEIFLSLFDVLEDWDWLYSTEVDRVVELLRRKGEAVPGLERIAMPGCAGDDLVAHGRLVVASEIAGVRPVDGESFRW